jgi:hypothetical protein
MTTFPSAARPARRVVRRTVFSALAILAVVTGLSGHGVSPHGASWNGVSVAAPRIAAPVAVSGRGASWD